MQHWITFRQQFFFLQWKSSKYYIFGMCVCSHSNQRAYAVLFCYLWPVWHCHVFPFYLKNGTILWEKLLDIKCVFWFALKLVSETFLTFTIIKRNEKVKWFRYRPGVVQRVGRGIALLFHDRGTRRGWVLSTPRPHFISGKEPVPILQEAGWAPGPVWTGFDPGPSSP